ncbi:YcaO-like family protein [Streptomyces sp. NPDC007901]|uniref:YcaO-like family protein n=1 Tax=Streptomyces sp. NPDC007901 TaxID=3364785 RepID=UPI0036E704F6
MTQATAPARPVSGKAIRAGTHRSRTAEETWEWIRPLLPSFGITRVAEVTWLDEIGIPVFQAIRPNARTLSVSQGKGISRVLARVSAVMEGIELWHAEHPTLPVKTCTVGDMEQKLSYPLEALTTAPRHALGPDSRLDWYPASTVDGRHPSYLPASLLHLDHCVNGRWTSVSFRATSNGLASGNTLDEAVLHGLYEVIERDASTRARRHPTGLPVSLSSVDDPSARLLLDRLEAAGVQVTVRFLPNPFGVPTFDAIIWSPLIPLRFAGAGTHLDTSVALCRALSEAAQSRATAIAGARDDIGQTAYREARFFSVNRSPGISTHEPSTGEALDFPSIPSAPLDDLQQEVIHVARRVASVTGFEPLHVDHTSAEFGVPVAHVVCPGAQFDTSH